MGDKTFKASRGWFAGFKTRFGISSVRRCGESESFEMTELAHSRLENITQALRGKEPCQIWNADETALFYKAVSSRSYKLSSEDAKNTKRSKERFIVTVCVSVAGEAFNMQAIGNQNTPVL